MKLYHLNQLLRFQSGNSDPLEIFFNVKINKLGSKTVKIACFLEKYIFEVF